MNLTIRVSGEGCQHSGWLFDAKFEGLSQDLSSLRRSILDWWLWRGCRDSAFDAFQQMYQDTLKGRCHVEHVRHYLEPQRWWSHIGELWLWKSWLCFCQTVRMISRSSPESSTWPIPCPKILDLSARFLGIRWRLVERAIESSFEDIFLRIEELLVYKVKY